MEMRPGGRRKNEKKGFFRFSCGGHAAVSCCENI